MPPVKKNYAQTAVKDTEFLGLRCDYTLLDRFEKISVSERLALSRERAITVFRLSLTASAGYLRVAYLRYGQQFKHKLR